METDAEGQTERPANAEQVEEKRDKETKTLRERKSMRW